MKQGKGIAIPSDRKFGLTFAVIFGLLSAWLYWRGSRFGMHVLIAAGVFGALGLAIPRVLHPLNVAWMKLGALLNMIVSPIVMGVMFYGLFAPIGLLFRLTGRDALRRTFERDSKSYWIDRSPPGPDGKTFPQQF